jgi:2-polyprenyl-3-methyl-5-hydroxy-6-metoxy-1,4-benzoquinol methylase
LDLGCGQGRDSIALAQLGYRVTGVDVSAVGVTQMMKQASEEGLLIEGIVDDMYTFRIDERYDIILLDSIFHFYKRDRDKETQFLKWIMHELKSGGILSIFVNKSKTTEPILKKIFEKSEMKWETLVSKYIKYPKMDSLYRMFIVRKLLR